MAREIQITPRRIQYAQKIEFKLFDTLMKIASEKQEEITRIIQKTLTDMSTNVEDVLDEYKGLIFIYSFFCSCIVLVFF